MCQKGEANFHYVTMFSLSRSVLLVCMRTRDVVGDANALKERIQTLILTTLICLHGNNFAIKQSFNMGLKKVKLLKYIRFIFEQIYPTKFAEIIDKTDIVFLPAYRDGSRTPNI